LTRFTLRLLGEGDLPIIPGMSDGALDPIVSVYVGWGWPFLVLHDGDNEGREQHERMKKIFDVLPSQHFALLPDVIGDARVKAFESLIQPYSGHASRQSLEIYSRLTIGDAQEEYDRVIGRFPV
jgi:hypothetical protein